MSAAILPHRSYTRGALSVLALISLGACVDFDPDMRRYAGGFATTDAARQVSANRPEGDARGVISYPTYQVVVARRGDTVATVASRIGLPAEELARHNGMRSGDTLRAGEVLSLPRRVAEPSGGVIASAPVAPSGGLVPEPVDVATIAGGAIDRAQGSGTSTAQPAPAVPVGAEPLRHHVKRGETAYTISRLYNVTVKALADWNGLDGNLTVREGQYLLIPVAAAGTPPRPAATIAAPTAPGTGSPTPEPPSAKKPLPAEKTVPAAAAPKDTPASPDLSKSATTKARLQMPVSGKIFREYAKGKNEGIDISAAAGAPVVAAEAGTVATITQNTDNVQIVVVRHGNNLLTVYAGLDRLAVKKGDKVSRGQQLGVVRAGNPPFLHFEVRQGLESTDPVPYLN